MIQSRDQYIILIRKYLFFSLYQRLHFLYNHQQPSRSARVSDSKWSPWESDPIFSNLKGGVGVVQELLEESLEPGSSLRSGLEGITQTTVEIVTGSGSEGSTIRFTTGYIKENVLVRLSRERAGSGILTLDPDEGIDESISGGSVRSDTETSTDLVAPISLLDLASWLLSAARLVDDETSTWPSCVGKSGADGVDVALLVTVGVGAGVSGASSDGPGVVVGNVGGKTTELLGGAGVLEDRSIHIRRVDKMFRPSEPSSVTTVQVHGDIGESELLDGIDGQILVGSGGAGALGHTHVGNSVGK